VANNRTKLKQSQAMSRLRVIGQAIMVLTAVFGGTELHFTR